MLAGIVMIYTSVRVAPGPGPGLLWSKVTLVWSRSIFLGCSMCSICAVVFVYFV